MNLLVIAADERDFARHVDDIRINPVKHGHVRRVADWQWSSFHRYVERGLLAPDWAVDPDDGGRLGD